MVRITCYFVLAFHVAAGVAYGFVELFLSGYHYLSLLILATLVGGAMSYILNSIDKNAEAKRKEIESEY